MAVGIRLIRVTDAKVLYSGVFIGEWGDPLKFSDWGVNDALRLREAVEEVEIEPFKTINKVIFAPTSKFEPNLAITLVDKETQDKLTFTFDEIR